MSLWDSTKPFEDWEKVLLLLGVQEGILPDGGLQPSSVMKLLDWDEQRANMAFARLQEFGFADKTYTDEGA